VKACTFPISDRELRPVAIVFYLVNPVMAFRRLLHQGGKHRLDELCTHKQHPMTRLNSGAGFRREQLRLPSGFRLLVEERPMADNKSQADSRDRSRITGEQDYEVQYLMKQTKISAEQARDLIKRFGNDRETLVREARKLDR
jgi:hypothetical protein